MVSTIVNINRIIMEVFIPMKSLNIKEWVFTALLCISTIALYAFAWGIPIMWIWNSVVPNISHMPEISYLQAVGIIAIGRIITYRWDQ